ncbi:lysosomal cholesterol signaling protein [Nerophis ophidion]|uniref:lysosomal cholesterol signaling protein n=1 Tax=Nerophis ophidion TaxID=159077 RepID=UPI002AE03CEE|nr:lysosomal cholesterol signaling protein [Nerophis ophidion]XP_061735994.1 lysosomal cholesterol signaling protein [Nerophis ophidion]
MRAGRSIIIIIIIIIMEISTATTVLPHAAGDLLDPPGPPSGISINKLLPALFKCFGIILCGYVAGRAKIITSTHAKGLGHFVSAFALPALLFKNMVLLDFENVIWPFIWSILVAKASVFAVVCVLTLLVSSPDSRYSKAGLFSIFATQSNDFALGYPIVKALYQSTYPEYLQYIYLVAPVSLMLLNPIGFTFCEVQKWKNQGDHQQGKLLIVGQVALQVLKNPIVFMVVIGIAAHFLLRQTIPSFMSDFVDGLANSFEGGALFYLGLSMVGQLKNLTRSTVVTLILLLTAKLLLMPLICKDMVDLLDNTSPVNHSSLSNYAFLYGAFPTAPSVAIYAVYYNSQLEVIISGMVISTFLSAPIMFTSAWLLTLRWMDSRLVMNALQDVRFYISVAGLVALLWTIAVMLFKKAFKRLPDMFTAHLFLAQFLTCFGMILWKFVAGKDNFICQILTFTLLSTSLYSTYVWPAFIALSLLLLRRFDNLKVSPGWFIFASWGIPAFITAVLLICGEKMPDTIDSSVFYSKPQIICTTTVLSLSLLLGGSSLVLLGRGSWVQEDRSGGENTSVEDLVTETEQDSQSLFEPEARSEDLNTGQNENGSESTACLVFRVDERHQNGHKLVARHVLLCLLLGLSLLANLCSCVWLLFHQHTGRLYVELQFFCAVANYGQGFLSFALFGLDKHLIILPFRKRLHLLWYGKKQGEQTQSDLPEEVRMVCTDFVKHHKVKCVHDIVRKRRCGVRTTVDCFLGCELVEWLQQAGLAQDEGEALVYGTRLQQGGVLEHIQQEHAFQGGLLFYSFVT